jgi:pSer/pThr/pTyr-binding forkhead associated (FHA) protein
MRIMLNCQQQIYKYSVTKASISIGRASSNDLVVPLEELSRRHCIITFVGQDAYITDLNSKNGVFINGHRIAAGQQTFINPINTIKLANQFPLAIVHDAKIHESDKTLEIEIQNAPLETAQAETKVLGNAGSAFKKKERKKKLTFKEKLMLAAVFLLMALQAWKSFY